LLSFFYQIWRCHIFPKKHYTFLGRRSREITWRWFRSALTR
jgi:hypothetical protein